MENIVFMLKVLLSTNQPQMTRVTIWSCGKSLDRCLSGQERGQRWLWTAAMELLAPYC